MLAAGNFLLMDQVVRERRVTTMRVFQIGITSALLFFTQPVTGAAMDVCWAVVALVRLRRDAVRIALVSAACLGLLLVPWTLRNERAVGAPIVTRSNFGLEFAIANYPGALERGDSLEGWSETGHTLHPNNALAAPEPIRAIGEVRYSRELGARAWRWAETHPREFALVSLRHWGQFFMPPLWATHSADLRGVRVLTVWAMSVMNGLGLLALAIGASRGSRRAALLLGFVLLLSLPYAVVQPVPRYTFTAYLFLTFPAAAALLEAYRRAIGVGRPSSNALAPS